MAVIKLGMLVSEIAGSIGGTTFRRYRGGTQMMNKNFGGSKAKQLSNPALTQMIGIANNWTALDSLVKEKWNTEALNFTFPDKFGNPKNLTGFELWIKLVNFNANVGAGVPDVDNLSNVVLTVDALNIETNWHGSAFIEFLTTLSNTTVILQIERVANVSISPTFTSRKIIKTQSINSNKTVDFTAEFDALFPSIEPEAVVILYWKFQNTSAFQSIPYSFPVVQL